MAENSKSKGWWKTVPGMLTATAGILTAVTGLIVGLNQVGLIGGGGEPSNTTKGVWLEIRRVELFGQLANSEVQVTGTVNDSEYVYPSLEGVQWMEAGPDMSSQLFSLPRSEQYRVRFRALVRGEGPVAVEVGGHGGEALVRGGGEEVQLISLKEDIVEDLPFEGRYRLHEQVGRTRRAGVRATIHYVITTDPD